MYDYEKQKPEVFKEENQVSFLRVRDNARRLFEIAGAARFDKLLKGVAGDSWTMLAYVDRLVEIGEINCVSPEHIASQYRVYVSNQLTV